MVEPLLFWINILIEKDRVIDQINGLGWSNTFHKTCILELWW